MNADSTQTTALELLSYLTGDEGSNQHPDDSMWLDGAARSWEQLAEMDDIAAARFAHQAEAEAMSFVGMDRVFLAAWLGALPVASIEPGETLSVWLRVAGFPRPLRREICGAIAGTMRAKAAAKASKPLG